MTRDTHHVYLTTLECESGHEVTIAHTGEEVNIDQDAPWPNVEYCPICAVPYPNDLAIAITEVEYR